MKYLAYPTIALATAVCLASCDDDHDDNPTIAPATEFVFNTPAYADQLIDLSQTDSLRLTWSQPNWGFPLVVNYNVQISTSGEFTTSYADQVADESGATVADYYALDITNQCANNVAAKDICRAIAALSGWESEDEVLAEQEVYVRVQATPNAKAEQKGLTICSNVVKLNTAPYYIALKDADPEMWYLIGACIGDGKWTNTPEALGVSNFTMSIISGAKYNSNTGKGSLVFNGYLTTDGFKIIRQRGDWNDQWGMNDGAFVFQDGGSGNITVAENGYYTVKLNNEENTVSIEPYDGAAPKVYESIAICGEFNGWDATNAMTPFSTAECIAGHNHLWSYTLEAPAGGTTAKFLTAGSWDTNWGGSEFPYGVGVGNGANISVPEGTWIVTFNDVDGSYAFTAK